LAVFLQFLLQTLAAVAVFADGSDLFLKDDVLRWDGTDDFREPAQAGWVPIGPAAVADIVSEQEDLETEFGVFEVGALLAEHGTRRDIYRVSAEWLGASYPQLELTAWQNGQSYQRLLAYCDPHGRWLEWLDNGKSKEW
jgi:Uncharacterized protein conserved in bacteria (DUF2332)